MFHRCSSVFICGQLRCGAGTSARRGRDFAGTPPYLVEASGEGRGAGTSARRGRDFAGTPPYLVEASGEGRGAGTPACCVGTLAGVLGFLPPETFPAGTD